MLVVVSYDVSVVTPEGRRRLRRVAKTCLSYGQRVQNSVFQCLLDPEQWALLKAKLLRIYQPDEDSLRFYFLGSNWRRRVEHHGTRSVPDLEGPLIA